MLAYCSGQLDTIAMRRAERDPERIDQYPEDVQQAASYIAENMRLAKRHKAISVIMPQGFRRANFLRIGQDAEQRARGASEVLGMLHDPPASETWIDAIRDNK
jgi:hypothetical protein